MTEDSDRMRHKTVHEFPGRFHNHLSIPVFLMLLAVLIGLIAGVAAFVLKWLIKFMTDKVYGFLDADGANWLLLIVPVVGILLAAMFQRYVLHRDISHGEERLDNDLRTRKYKMPFSLTFTPLLASSLTLGFGGSAGSEGPIAYVGGAIGSNVGRCFKMSPSIMKVLLACGAGAGIAGIFMAPVGGALFAFEVLCVQLSMAAVLAVFVSALTAGMTTYMLMGNVADIPFGHVVVFEWGILPWLLLAGVFCGVYSCYYASVMSKMRVWYDSFRNQWLKNIVAGVILAVLIFLFPVLYGEGYGFIGKTLGGQAASVALGGPFLGMIDGKWTVLILLAGVLAVKAFATSSTNSGGGVAGDFAPTLFAGCVAGYFFASLLNTLLGLSLPESDFAFYGMSAVMAGAIRAPLMAMFLTVEMARCYEMLLPVAIVSAISYMVVHLYNVMKKRRLSQPKS